MPMTKLASCARTTAFFAAFVLGVSFGAPSVADEAFSMKIMDVFTITDRGTVLTGQVASGSLAVGDQVCIPLQDGETAARNIDGIEMFRKLLERAEKGQMVGILVQVDKKQVVKGALLHTDC